MMENTMLQLRIDSRLKEEASSMYAKLGLDLPTAIQIFLTRSVQLQDIPFVVQLPDEDSASNAAVSAMKRMSAMSAKNGIANMTLDEINAEIEEALRGKIIPVLNDEIIREYDEYISRQSPSLT